MSRQKGGGSRGTGTGLTGLQVGRPAVAGPSEASPSHVGSHYWWVCDEIILLQLREQDAFRWSTSHL